MRYALIAVLIAIILVGCTSNSYNLERLSKPITVNPPIENERDAIEYSLDNQDLREILINTPSEFNYSSPKYSSTSFKFNKVKFMLDNWVPRADLMKYRAGDFWTVSWVKGHGCDGLECSELFFTNGTLLNVSYNPMCKPYYCPK